MDNVKFKDFNLVCKYCEQEISYCPCNEVDKFFESNWDLMNEDSWKAIVPKDIKDID